jgi:hypothetical protein|tara:strand:+ start:2340 stop:2798 length:459 start_codon:yes stop_codon:yes gene_type:complete
MYNKEGYRKARASGFRSGLEQIIAKQIKQARHKIRYEAMKIQWVDFSIRSYTPDFVLDNGIILEVKGFWSTADRRKHVEIKTQHTHLDIRMVFENSRRKIRKGSKTTYADWCKKKDIPFCDRVVPKTWLTEKLIMMPPKLIETKGTLHATYS